jgi:hypothetical protein
MSHKKGWNDVYNKGCDFEIEVLFIKQWHEIKAVLYKHMWVKPLKIKFKIPTKNMIES